MIREVFTVRDMVADIYLDPFMERNAGAAIRAFQVVCSREGHQFHEHPQDFALYHVGSFDCQLGQLVPMEPRKLADGSQFVNYRVELTEQGQEAVNDA